MARHAVKKRASFEHVACEKRTDAQVGEALRKRREALGITQAQLGTAMSVSYQQVQKYERGHNRVATSKLLFAADLLKCDISELYGWSSTEPLPGSQRILRAWSRLDAPKREAVAAMLEAFGSRRASATQERPVKRAECRNFACVWNVAS